MAFLFRSSTCSGAGFLFSVTLQLSRRCSRSVVSRSVSSTTAVTMEDRPSSALVATTWLAENLFSAPKLRVIDASWYMPNAGRDCGLEFRRKHIPHATFFDIDVVKDETSPLPHMLPSVEDFRTVIEQHHGVSSDSQVVIYSTNGFVGSARVWWTFRCFGFHDVKVLDGGFKKWIEEGHPVADETVRWLIQPPLPHSRHQHCRATTSSLTRESSSFFLPQ